MMLDSLCRYYEAMYDKNVLPPENWSVEPVVGAIEIDDDGTVIAIHDLRIQKRYLAKGKEKIKAIPCQMIVPMLPVRTSGKNPSYLCDNGKYLLGMDLKNKEVVCTPEYFSCARQYHLEQLKNATGECAHALINYFEKYGNGYPDQKVFKEIGTGNYVFRLHGKYLHEDFELKTIWARKCIPDKSTQRIIDLVTGEEDYITVVHNQFKGIPGAQSSGAPLISFNENSFESWMKDKSLNSPVGRKSSFMYSTALKHLISSVDSRTLFDDSVVVYWSESGDKRYQEIASLLMGNSAGSMDIQEINSIYKSLSKGYLPEVGGLQLDPAEGFSILGLSGNGGRIVVRFYLESSFGNLIDNISQHFSRCEIVKSSRDKEKVLYPCSMISTTVSKKAKKQNPNPSLAPKLLEAIIENANYPESLFTGVMMRIRSNPEQFDWKEAATLRAFLIKNRGNSERILTMNLNEKNDSQAYVLGRLFAQLEFLQNAASSNGLNATIKDKYFASAAATPARVFPVLISLSNNHLKKIKSNKGAVIAYDKKISDLISKLGGSFPKSLPLEEQGEFYIGYYQERQNTFNEMAEKKK